MQLAAAVVLSLYESRVEAVVVPVVAAVDVVAVHAESALVAAAHVAAGAAEAAAVAAAAREAPVPFHVHAVVILRDASVFLPTLERPARGGIHALFPHLVGREVIAVALPVLGLAKRMWMPEKT